MRSIFGYKSARGLNCQLAKILSIKTTAAMHENVNVNGQRMRLKTADDEMEPFRGLLHRETPVMQTEQYVQTHAVIIDA
jgi:hypothetical protein